MFDLKYFVNVSAIMEWTTDSPAVTFANVHQSYVNKHPSSLYSNQVQNILQMTEEQFMIRDYILRTYPAYFGLKLNFGNYASQNMDMLLNSSSTRE